MNRNGDITRGLVANHDTMALHREEGGDSEEGPESHRKHVSNQDSPNWSEQVTLLRHLSMGYIR